MKTYKIKEELKNALMVFATQRATGTFMELSQIVKALQELEEIKEEVLADIEKKELKYHKVEREGLDV